jgi:hypothetical protein
MAGVGRLKRICKHAFRMARAIIQTDGMEKSQKILARGLSTQLSIFEGSIAEMLRF